MHTYVGWCGYRWYGSPEPGDFVFVERKTHRESWKGEESVKDRITLPKARIVDFLDGSYQVLQALEEGKVLHPAQPCCLRHQVRRSGIQNIAQGYSRLQSLERRPRYP